MKMIKMSLFLFFPSSISSLSIQLALSHGASSCSPPPPPRPVLLASATTLPPPPRLAHPRPCTDRSSSTPEPRTCRRSSYAQRAPRRLHPGAPASLPPPDEAPSTLMVENLPKAALGPSERDEAGQSWFFQLLPTPRACASAFCK